MNHASWKTPRVRWGCALALTFVFFGFSACSGDSGRPSSGGRSDVTTAQDTAPVEDVQPPEDIPPDVPPPPEDVPLPEDVPVDVPPPADVPPPEPPAVAIVAPAEGAAIARQQPIEFRVQIDHPDGVNAVQFGFGDITLEQRDVRVGPDNDKQPAPSGEFAFVLSDYFLPDGEPLPGPNDQGVPNRRYPREGEYTFFVRAASGGGTLGEANVKVFIDATPPSLVLRDSPIDRGLEVLDVVGQVRVAYRAGDNHALRESRVRLTWEEGGETKEQSRTLVPTRTSEYIVVFEVDESVDRADLAITSEDEAGQTRTLELPVRIIGRPPYRLGHVFEFPNEAVIEGYALGHYDDSDEYPDLWVSTTDGLWLLLGTAGGQFQGGYKLTDAQTPAPSRLFLHDFDNDGLEDLLLVAADGSAAQASVAIRIPATVEGTIDDYKYYPAITVPNGTTSVALAYVDEEYDGPTGELKDPESAVIDLVVGLSHEENSVGVLLGIQMPNLPLTEVYDPVAPGAPCDPPCPGFMTCHNGGCHLASSEECNPACGLDKICLEDPRPDIGFACFPFQDDDVCGGCPVGTRCFANGCRDLMTADCDPPCADIYTCYYGECILPDTGDCTTPCADDETCVHGTCVLRVGGLCDPECGDRQVCHDGVCVLADEQMCSPPCWGGEVCHVTEQGGQETGRCVRRCDDGGCGAAPDEPPFFQRPHFIRGVAGITDVHVADFNNDGFQDIVVGRSGVRQVSCYINKGDPAAPGDFLDAYDTYIESDPVSIHPLRFNADGEDQWRDLLVATEGGKLYILEGEGTGFFNIIDIYGDRDDNIRFAGPVREFAEATVFSDLDLVTTEPGGSRLRLWRYSQSTSDDTHSSPRYFHTSAFSAGENPGELTTADMNADGVDDIVYINRGTGRLVVGLNMLSGGGLPSEDFDIPPEILIFAQKSVPDRYPDGICEGYENGCLIDLDWDVNDIAVGNITSNTVAQQDLVMLVSGPIPAGERGPQVLGRDGPEKCGADVVGTPTVRVALKVVPTNGVRPRGDGRWTWMNDLFSATPSGLVLGKIDSDDAPDAAIAFPREPSAWDLSTRCICETPEGGEEVCSRDPESVVGVPQPNVAVLRNGRTPDGDFEFFADVDSSATIDVSVRGVGFATIPEEGEIDVTGPSNYLPETERGFFGVQVPVGLMAMDFSRDGLDDLLVLSDELTSPTDLGLCADPGEPSPCFEGEKCYWGECRRAYAPPQLTVWRAPTNESGVFDGPRFGVTLGRMPGGWTFVQANPVNDDIPDVLVSNMADDDLSLVIGGTQSRLSVPRYLATQDAPLGIHATKLDGLGDAGEGDTLDDFIVAVTGNVQVGYGRPADFPAQWSFEDVVFLYPGGTYPREGPTGVHAFDFNRDAQRDIIVANKDSDTATMFFGVGDRLFPAYLDVNTGHEPTKLVIADFNGDKCKDYAVLNTASGSVTLVLSIPGECPQ